MFLRLDTSIRPDRFVAFLIGGVIAVLAAVIVLALSQSDLALAGATVVLLSAAAVVASTAFRLLRDDGD
jgi:uncharacterized MnhB-related membrane protein